MNTSQAVLIALCALSALLVVALLFVCRALIAVRTQLGLEIGRKQDLDALNEARQRALDAQREALKNEFGELAARLLNDKQRNLTDANARSVALLFNQLQEKLKKYEEEVEKAAGENTRLGEHMKTQLAALQNFADRAQAFTAALIGGNKMQGNRGEAMLASILERSGLQRGVHYDVQQGGQVEGRPDVSIYDAMNRHIVLVDSKMNIKDYISASSLPDDEAHRGERERAFKAHAASIRRQIDNLASKNYAETVAPTRAGYTNLPVVAMFCPFNAVLEAALDRDPALMQYAYEKRIVLVTPLTLWGYLLLISHGWKQREVERKFDEIQKLGGEVVASLDLLVNDIEAIGAAIDNAGAAYDGLRKRAIADKGRMSVRRVARKLMEYGIAPPGKLKQLDKCEAPLSDDDETPE